MLKFDLVKSNGWYSQELEFKIKVLKSNLDLNNVNDKAKFLTEIAKILS